MIQYESRAVAVALSLVVLYSRILQNSAVQYTTGRKCKDGLVIFIPYLHPNGPCIVGICVLMAGNCWLWIVATSEPLETFSSLFVDFTSTSGWCYASTPLEIAPCPKPTVGAESRLVLCIRKCFNVTSASAACYTIPGTTIPYPAVCVCVVSISNRSFLHIPNHISTPSVRADSSS